MIAYADGSKRFSLRAAGVAIDSERVLLHRAATDDIWAMPGGRVELLEPAPDTLRREIVEEIGVTVIVHRLLWVAENFYEDKGLSYHELGMYFAMTLPAGCPQLKLASFVGKEGPPERPDALRLIYQWHPLSSLPNLPLYPTFLRQGLLALPAATQHIVHRDI